MVINRSIRNEGLYKSAILVILNRNISGSKMNIQEWFSPQERASNPLKISFRDRFKCNFFQKVVFALTFYMGNVPNPPPLKKGPFLWLGI